MEALRYLDFDLEILEKDRGYEAHVIRSPAGEARAPFPLPFDRKDLDLVRASIEKAVLRRTAVNVVRRRSTLEVAKLREFGEKLFAGLMGNSVRDCYSRSCHEAQKEGCGLRLKLRLPTSLSQVPWEFLYSRSDGDFLGLSIYRSIVRYLELPHLPVESLRVPAPLCILAAIAKPQAKRLAPLDVAREKRVIKIALADLVQRGLVTLDFLEGHDTFHQLTRRLRREPYHVLHFIGHGGYDEETQEGVLFMENEQGGEAWVGSENLSRLLRDCPCTRLVFLNVCQGAVTSEADPFSSVAGALVRAGVPAVVAMQFEITDAAAIVLAREFYTALADNLPVDAALAEARKQIVFEDPDSLEWATPVLFMRVADGRLFDVTAALARPLTQPPTPGPAIAPTAKAPTSPQELTTAPTVAAPPPTLEAGTVSAEAATALQIPVSSPAPEVVSSLVTPPAVGPAGPLAPAPQVLAPWRKLPPILALAGVIGGVILLVGLAWGARLISPRPTPTRTPTPTMMATKEQPPTTTPPHAVVSVVTPPASATPTAEATPVPTLAPTFTLAPKPTSAPTNTLSQTPTYTPIPTKSQPSTPTVAVYPAPILVSPDNGASVSELVTFVWNWTGPALTADHGFEVRIWKEGQPDHYGAASTVRTTSATLNVRGAYGVQQGGSGRYLWTVAVVRLEPYQRIGSEAAPRTLEIWIGAPPTWTPPP